MELHLTEEIKEFRAWMRRNSEHLKKHDLWTIVTFAQYNGFPDALIYRELSHWPMDKETHTELKTRLEWNVDRELKAIEGVVNLEEQWYHLWRYVDRGIEFDEAV